MIKKSLKLSWSYSTSASAKYVSIVRGDSTFEASDFNNQLCLATMEFSSSKISFNDTYNLEYNKMYYYRLYIQDKDFNLIEASNIVSAKLLL